jgi:hypothetical protein
MANVTPIFKDDEAEAQPALSNNPLVRARQEADERVQELITKDEALAQRLEEIAKGLLKWHDTLQAAEERTALEEGKLIAEAYARLGDGMAFTSWWDRDETWGSGQRVGRPFTSQKARELKRLHDFCEGTLVGKSIGRPKNPEGFTITALNELLMPKYVQDRNGNELNNSRDERTPESQKRLDVVEEVYGKLKRKARDWAARAQATGAEPARITRKEVVKALQQAFTEKEMPVVARKLPVSNKPFSWWQEEVRDQMDRFYFAWQTEPEKIEVLRQLILEELQTWTDRQEVV